MSKKRYAVIGAGIVGAGSTKALIDEGFNVVVFEKTDYTFGLWRYQEKVDKNSIASVMKSTVINTSKEVSAISNYPPPSDYPNYMHNTLNIKYFESAAKEWNYESYIRFRHQVTSVEMAPDHEHIGRWTVKYRNLAGKNPEVEHSEIFDGLAVCIGYHNLPNIPTFKGQETFKGKIMHTHSLKKVDASFENKVVVVVGIGNSATDAAVELSTLTRQVYLSTRSGAWVSSRVGPGGMPFDTIILRRFVYWLVCLLPYWLINNLTEAFQNACFDHEKYQIKPEHRPFFPKTITINDALPNKIMCGMVVVKGDIDYFVEDGVVFKGEKAVTQCNVVVLGTGYKLYVPFLSEDILPVERKKVRLYKHIFVPHIAHAHTLGIMGHVVVIGPALPVAELQSRWFAQLQTEKCKLPSRKVMETEIDRVKGEFARLYKEADKRIFQTYPFPYMDELATEIGCLPPLWKFLFTDPRLFYHLIFGIFLPYQYRLVGPGAWSGAREAILNVDKRIAAPFYTNATKKRLKLSLFSFSFTKMFILGIICLAFFSFLLSKL